MSAEIFGDMMRLAKAADDWAQRPAFDREAVLHVLRNRLTRLAHKRTAASKRDLAGINRQIMATQAAIDLLSGAR